MQDITFDDRFEPVLILAGHPVIEYVYRLQYQSDLVLSQILHLLTCVLNRF